MTKEQEEQLRSIIREEIIQLDEKSMYRSRDFKKIMTYIHKIKQLLKILPNRYENKSLESLSRIEFYVDQFGIAREED